METLLQHVENDISGLDGPLATDILDHFSGLPTNLIDELEDVLNQVSNVDDAFALLGKQAGVGAAGLNPWESGKSMFFNNVARLSSEICNNKLLQSYCENKNSIDVSTCAGLVLGGLYVAQTHGINIVLISIIVSRLGIRKFCDRHWDL